jgi:ABC-2 type transport system permease protein
MAVYERNYGRYQGALTPSWARFLVLPRYAYQEVFKSRMFVAFFALCFLVPFAGLLIIYLHHNLSALQFMGLSFDQLKEAIPIDGWFFERGMSIQSTLAFVLVLLVGPTLVAPDLRNNGLPLYLSRPFSRTEYVLGKLAVLLILLSLITWIPGLLLVLFQGYLEGGGWLADNARIPAAIFLGSWAWILTLSLLALAVSAWVKWKPVARVALLMLFFALSGFGKVINEVLRTWWGSLLSLGEVITRIWQSLFGVDLADPDIPLAAAWTMMGLWCLISLWLLSRRIRAYEVVR